MKITLHKPQREATNAVLAYHYEPADDIGVVEDEDPIWWSYWAEDAICRNDDCQHEHGAGDCHLWADSTNQGC